VAQLYKVQQRNSTGGGILVKPCAHNLAWRALLLLLLLLLHQPTGVTMVQPTAEQNQKSPIPEGQ